MTRIFIFISFFAISSCQTVGKVVTEPFRGDTGITDQWTSYEGEIEGVEGAEYRVYLTGENPEQTIVFNHGYLDTVTFLEESLHDEELLKNLTQGFGSVRIVVVSYGVRWMVTPGDKTESPKDATVEVFTDKVLPYLEKKYEFKGPYALVGRSMGGSNAATLCAARPDLWTQCVLLNPMLVPDRTNPFKIMGNDQWKASFIIKSQYEDLESWHEGRPSALLKKTDKLPRTYVTACVEDGFNLWEGPQEWASQARERGFDVIWDPQKSDCDHETWPLENVLSFFHNKGSQVAEN